MFPTQNLHVKETVRLLTPSALKAEFPMSEASNRTVVESRQNVMEILEQKDSRLLVVVGPCSIHDVDAALEYGARLNALRTELGGQMEIVMRVYFEKPRTTIGWKGLINDPHLDGTYDIESGLKKSSQAAPGIDGGGAADGDGISRSDYPAIHGRPGDVGGGRRAHDGVANASGNGQWAFDADRVQERHGWQSANRVGCDAIGADATQLSRN